MPGTNRPVHGALLAAGLGTRLQPLTHHRPKPLVPLGAGLLLERGLEALAALRPAAVGINVFHLGEAWDQALAHRSEPLVFIRETTLQGTGGGLRGIAAALGSAAADPAPTLAVVNGDALFDFELAPLLAAHRAAGVWGTLVLRRVPAGSPFARVAVDADGRLWHIAEISAPGAEAVDPARLTWAAFTGVQFVEPPLLAGLPPEGEADVLRTAWRRGLAEGWPLQAIFAPDRCFWADVGSVPDYLAAHRALLEGRLEPHGAPPADGSGRRIEPGARVAGRVIGPAAVLAGAEVASGAEVGPCAWIGAGASVAAGVRVRDAVVWPGVRLTEDLVGGVALPPRP